MESIRVEKEALERRLEEARDRAIRVQEEVATAEVLREADEGVQDPEGTRTSKDLHQHPGNLMQQAVVGAMMTPPPHP